MCSYLLGRCVWEVSIVVRWDYLLQQEGEFRHSDTQANLYDALNCNSKIILDLFTVFRSEQITSRAGLFWVLWPVQLHGQLEHQLHSRWNDHSMPGFTHIFRHQRCRVLFICANLPSRHPWQRDCWAGNALKPAFSFSIRHLPVPPSDCWHTYGPHLALLLHLRRHWMDLRRHHVQAG